MDVDVAHQMLDYVAILSDGSIIRAPTLPRVHAFSSSFYEHTDESRQTCRCAICTHWILI